MNPLLQERLIAVALQRRAAIESARDNSEPLLRVPTKRQVKHARKSFVKLVRANQADSMLNMARPAFHRPVPMLAGEREKAMFAAHERRQAAGWIRG